MGGIFGGALKEKKYVPGKGPRKCWSPSLSRDVLKKLSFSLL